MAQTYFNRLQMQVGLVHVTLRRGKPTKTAGYIYYFLCTLHVYSATCTLQLVEVHFSMHNDVAFIRLNTSMVTLNPFLHQLYFIFALLLFYW